MGGFILDGYPRDIDQAVTFRWTLTAGDRLIVIDIEIDLEKVIPRLTGRRTCTSCNERALEKEIFRVSSVKRRTA